MMPAGDPSAMKILLATDGFEGAELATRVAAELAESTGAELHLVHVGLVPLIPPYPEVLDWGEDLGWAEREARRLLDEQAEMAKGAGGAGAHLRWEPPAEGIVALAEELGASLIVVGRRNRGRIKRALAGSVSDRVIRDARCPVLVVGSQGDTDDRARLSRGTPTARPETSEEVDG